MCHILFIVCAHLSKNARELAQPNSNDETSVYKTATRK